MTYLVNDKCIKCKHMDCVEVCPVDCFYEGENMLVINPDECIDCGVCEPECPVEAIIPDTVEDANKWLEVNTKYSELWPNIATKKEMMQKERTVEGCCRTWRVLLTKKKERMQKGRKVEGCCRPWRILCGN